MASLIHLPILHATSDSGGAECTGRLWCPHHLLQNSCPLPSPVVEVAPSPAHLMTTGPSEGPITIPALPGCGDSTLPVRALLCQAGVFSAASSLRGSPDLPAPLHCLDERTEIWPSCKLWGITLCLSERNLFSICKVIFCLWPVYPDCVLCLVTACTTFISDHLLTVRWMSLACLYFLSPRGCAGGLGWKLRVSSSLWRTKPRTAGKEILWHCCHQFVVSRCSVLLDKEFRHVEQKM